MQTNNIINNSTKWGGTVSLFVQMTEMSKTRWQSEHRHGLVGSKGSIEHNIC